MDIPAAVNQSATPTLAHNEPPKMDTDGKIQRTTTTTVQVTVPSFPQTAPGTPAVSVKVTNTTPELTDAQTMTHPDNSDEKEGTKIQSVINSEPSYNITPSQPTEVDIAVASTSGADVETIAAPSPCHGNV